MRFAAKKLTRSDLTFFEYQYRRQNAGNQKAINLNRNVFVDLIFPLAAEAAGGIAKQFPVPVAIYGPGLRSEPHLITRKVIAKGGSQKNWRLNGEFVPDPEFDVARYHELARDDVAVFAFDGENGLPSAVYIVLLSKAQPSDATVLADVSDLLAGKRMVEIGTGELSGIVERSPPHHPIRELLEAERDEALQEAALGSAQGVEKLLRHPSPRRMSAEALAKARQQAEATGHNGEAIVDVWLRKEVREGRLKEIVWLSAINAVSPWDFEATTLSDELVRIEVKSTTGPFNRDFHISQAEVLYSARKGAPRTNLYRVYALSKEAAWLQISSDIGNFCAGIAECGGELPTGVMPDGYTMQPSAVGNWSEPIQLNYDDIDDDEQ